MPAGHLELMLQNYGGGIAFSTGLTGFLVQAKAALDALCEMINQFYAMNIRTSGGYAVDTELMAKKIQVLKPRNRKLAAFLLQEIGPTSAWFNGFKEFRDGESTHRKRSPRNLVFRKKQELEIEIGGKKTAVGPYCVDLMEQVNRIIETSYGLMI